MAFEHSPWQTSVRFAAQAKDKLMKKRDYAAELGALGYPQFSYLKKKKPSAPGKLLFDALDESELDSRIAEGLPWLARTSVDMDWDWLVQNAKLHRRQNRLGFVLALALDLARAKNENERMSKLRWQLEKLESIRLTEEDTFSHDSMTKAERVWLREHRSPVAAHWNILSDMKAENLDAKRY
jgi:hypothetical protein